MRATATAVLARPSNQLEMTMGPTQTSLAKFATAPPVTLKVDGNGMDTDAMTVIDSHTHLDVLLGR